LFHSEPSLSFNNACIFSIIQFLQKHFYIFEQKSLFYWRKKLHIVKNALKKRKKEEK